MTHARPAGPLVVLLRPVLEPPPSSLALFPSRLASALTRAVSLLRFPAPPPLGFLAARSGAITGRGVLRNKPALAPLQQTQPRSVPSNCPLTTAGKRGCSRRAHGRDDLPTGQVSGRSPYSSSRRLFHRHPPRGGLAMVARPQQSTAPPTSSHPFLPPALPGRRTEGKRFIYASLRNWKDTIGRLTPWSTSRGRRWRRS